MKRTAFSLLTFLFCFGAFVPSTVKAQSVDSGQLLRISPVILHLPLSPSKQLTYEVTVENLRPSPLPLRVNMTDFTSEGEDGGYVFSDTKQNPLLQWISLSENEFILKANEKKTLTLQVVTPKTIKPGGYYGIVFFEPVLPRTDQKTLISTRIGLLVLGTLGFVDQKNHAEILTFTIPHFSDSFSLPFNLRVKNAGLNYFTAKPILTLKPLLGDEKQVFIEEKIIFPDTVRRWEENLAVQDGQYGFYNVTLSVSTGDGNRVTQHHWLLLFPFTKTILVLSTVIILVSGVVLRKRILRGAKAFFSSSK